MISPQSKSFRPLKPNPARRRVLLTALFMAWVAVPLTGVASAPRSGNLAISGDWFQGKFYRGRGDMEYLQLLEIARRMFEPDPELQNLAMLYFPDWNGLVEGPTWRGWWIQNSYGTTYSLLPFLGEPFLTFLQNSHDLWFDQMGDGQRVGAPPPYDWVAPDGALCDAAEPGRIIYKQGDGRIDLHDWALEFTAAGVVMQAELLLIRRDASAIARYLPLLERCVRFVESRRDPTNHLFWAGPAANLLAPSYAGWRRPDGNFDKAYLAGLSITHLAALNRMIELEELAGRGRQAADYGLLRDAALRALPLLTTPEGYFVKSVDPDGTKHGVLSADKHAYFEAPPNHDAIAFRVVDDATAEKIYRQIAALPGLRPHDFILPNFPSYDDMYEKPAGLWAYGHWVNGGHWSTCEARMILAYYRLGRYDDARRSMRRLLTFARRFRMDNPLTHFGREVYQPNEPINLCYDAFGPAAAFLRGLFEYLYHADRLVLCPHIPPTITELHQLTPVRFGPKRIYLSTVGAGPVTAVRLNGQRWPRFNPTSVTLPYEQIPAVAQVEIVLGKGRIGRAVPPRAVPLPVSIKKENLPPELVALDSRAKRLRHFLEGLRTARLADTYEAAHARLALESIVTLHVRRQLQREGRLRALPEASQRAADKAYLDTAVNLCNGLEAVLAKYKGSRNPTRTKIHSLWEASGQ